jgi:hypothetical protein
MAISRVQNHNKPLAQQWIRAVPGNIRNSASHTYATHGILMPEGLKSLFLTETDYEMQALVCGVSDKIFDPTHRLP